MTKAPLGGRYTDPNPTDRAKRGRNGASSPRQGLPVGIADEGANRDDHLVARPTQGRLPRPPLGRRRTHSWLNRHRAILIHWSKKPENHLALLYLACALITSKATNTAPLPG
jgi:hypothetical protein